VGSVLVLRPLDVHALDLEDTVDDLVALDDPLLAGVAAPRTHPELLALSARFEREVVESGSDGPVTLGVPELVGRLVVLAVPHDHLRPGVTASPADVQSLPVQLAHDLELTSSV